MMLYYIALYDESDSEATNIVSWAERVFETVRRCTDGILKFFSTRKFGLLYRDGCMCS